MLFLSRRYTGGERKRKGARETDRLQPREVLLPAGLLPLGRQLVQRVRFTFER